MKLFHITTVDSAESILSSGFHGQTHERGDVIPPWMSRKLLGQQGEDRVSMTFGGLASVPWRKMVAAGAQCREDELAFVEIELAPEDTKVFVSMGQVFKDGRRSTVGVSFEVTAPREVVNRNIVGVHRVPVNTPLTEAFVGWRKAFRFSGLARQIVDSLSAEAQATHLIAMWLTMGLPEGPVRGGSIIEADLKLRRELYRLLGQQGWDLLPEQKKILKKWGVNL